MTAKGGLMDLALKLNVLAVLAVFGLSARFCWERSEFQE